MTSKPRTGVTLRFHDRVPNHMCLSSKSPAVHLIQKVASDGAHLSEHAALLRTTNSLDLHSKDRNYMFRRTLLRIRNTGQLFRNRRHRQRRGWRIATRALLPALLASCWLTLICHPTSARSARVRRDAHRWALHDGRRFLFAVSRRHST